MASEVGEVDASGSSASASFEGDVAALLLRLVLGVVLLGHALQKLGWFEGGGYPTSIDTQADVVKFFGYDHTHLMAWLITLTEDVSGSFLLAGLLTPLAAAGQATPAATVGAGTTPSGGLHRHHESLPCRARSRMPHRAPGRVRLRVGQAFQHHPGRRKPRPAAQSRLGSDQ